MDTKAIEVAVQRKVTNAMKAATAVEIHSDEDMRGATELLSNVKKLQVFITNEKEKITKPMNEALKNARNLFRPFEDNVEEASRVIKFKMTEYIQSVDAARKEEEEKIAKKIESGRMKVETGLTKMEKLPEAPKRVQAESGGVQVRTIKKVVIKDPEKLPREYLIPDEVKIRKVALAGVEIPGVEVLEEKSIASI